MARWTLVFWIALLGSTTLVLGKGGRGGGGRGGGGSRGGGSKSGGSGSSYPKQHYYPAPAPAPPSYPSYPKPPSYPSAPPSYPSYPSAPSSYPRPPSYPSYPSAPPSYPGRYPAPPSYPSYPAGPIKPPKVGGGGGIGTHVAAAAAGAVAGAAIASHLPRGPRINMYMPMGHNYHHGGGYYGDSSSEEYFRPYYTGSGNRYYAPPERPGYQLTEEGRQIVEMTKSLNVLCEKLQQPAACTMLKLQGVRPFTHTNSMFNYPVEPPPYPPDFNAPIPVNNETVPVVNGTLHSNTTHLETNKEHPAVLYPDLPVLIPPGSGQPLTTTTTRAPQLTEDRLKAAGDLLDALEGI